MELIVQTQQELAVLPATWLAQLPAACQLQVVSVPSLQQAWLQIGSALAQSEPDSALESDPSGTGAQGLECEPMDADCVDPTGARPAGHPPRFERDEVRWLVVGVALERFDAEDFLRCCHRKAVEPNYRLSGSEALSGLPLAELGLQALEQRVAEQPLLTALACLEQLGLRLTAVRMWDEPREGGVGLAHAA